MEKQKYLISTMFLLLGLIIGAIVASLWSGNNLTVTPGNFIIFSICFICFLIAVFIFQYSRPNGESHQSFGLPQGTIRATLALILILFFMLFSIYAIQDSSADNGLVDKILTTMATLVIAAVSFYFGVKATEQGAEFANKIYGEVSKSTSNENVPVSVIQEAINRSKEKWIKEYSCRDIRLGKKQTQDGQVDLDCLVFLVEEKKEPSDLENIIPPTIPFKHQGKDYSIPTDVRPYSGVDKQKDLATSYTNAFQELDLDAQKGLIREFIQINATDLIKEYPEIQGITDFKKIVNETQKDYYSIQFKVAEKDPNLSVASRIPPYFEFESAPGNKYLIPTDIVGEGNLEEAVWHGTGENPKRLGLSVSTISSKYTGTIGLKIFWQEKFCLMTCCHVLFKDEILLNPHKTSFEGNNKDVVSPSTKDKRGPQHEKIGVLIQGWYDPFLDIALAELKDDGVLVNELYTKNKKIGGLKNISSERDIGTEVKMFGRSSYDTYGTIVDYLQPITNIRNSRRIIRDLIVCNFHSEEGDSGAIVVEHPSNKLIGILVANSDKFSYVISIQYIIDFLKIEKKNNEWLN